MKNTWFALAVAAALLLVSYTTASAIITTDPNAGSAPATEEAQPQVAQDERLAQRVSYSGYKRLHTILDELTQSTGVTIIAGKNRDDWQVRDLPLSVFVKDMPLGELLQSIADAAHLALTSREVDDTITYRIWRTSALEKEFNDFFDFKRTTSRQSSDWAWAALEKCTELSFEQITPPKTGGSYSPQQHTVCQTMGAVLKELGDAGKAKLRSGDYITIDVKSASPSMKRLLTNLYNSAWQQKVQWRATYEPDTVKEIANPTTEEIGKAIFTMNQRKDDDGISLSLIPLRIGGSYTAWSSSLFNEAYSYREGQQAGIPPLPKPSVMPSVTQPLSANLVEIKDENWEQPFLQTKVKLELPKAEDGPVSSDVFQELCEKGGVNIICEDFWSHRHPFNLGLSRVFNCDTTTGKALRAAREMRWYLDTDRKLVIGHVFIWQDHHQRLVPESMLANFRAKLDGEGAGIDDYLPFLWLDSQQYNEWVTETRNMPDFSQGYIHDRDKPMWQLYDYISPQDKQFAKSESGFPLAKCDPTWLETALKKRIWEMENTMKYYYIDSPDKWDSDYIPADIKAAAKMVMYLKTKKPEFIPRVEIKDGSKNTYLDSTLAQDSLKRWYYLELTGGDSENKSSTELVMRLAFPLYSPKREAELAEEAAGNK